MEYRTFGKTGMRLSAIGVGGLLAHYYEGYPAGSASPGEKRAIYLRALDLGINLFDTGYGDEAYLPDELKCSRPDLHFALKAAPQQADDLPPLVEKHLRHLRREAIDILRVHHYQYLGLEGLAEVIAVLKRAGKVRSLCLIRHYRADQEAFAERGPEPEADADLVIYNYVCRWQEPGLLLSQRAGRGVLIMKALGGQWLSWHDKTTTDWAACGAEKILELSGAPGVENDLALIHPIVNGPWREMAGPGERVPSTERAVQWVMQNPAVSSVLVGVASVSELEEAFGAGVDARRARTEALQRRARS
jgi:aryl-alcohol dehydrogenase-like predicted oxidoreductase